MFKVAKSAVEGAVFLFAAYAFATVPLGKHTALQHVIAILNTKEAAEAGKELKQAGSRVVEDLLHSTLAGEARVPPLEPPQSKLAWQSEPDAGAHPRDALDAPSSSSEQAASPEPASPEPASSSDSPGRPASP